MKTRWQHLIDDLRNSKDVDLAFRASQFISEYADESCVPDLYALLQDENFYIRETAADPLARLEGINALPALFMMLTRGEEDGHDNDGICEIIGSLIESDKKEALPLLLEMLKSPQKKTGVTKQNSVFV